VCLRKSHFCHNFCISRRFGILILPAFLLSYSSSDFLSNLLVLLLRIMNAGLSDSGLLTHLSEATAGSLSGVGHSSVYEDPGVFE